MDKKEKTSAASENQETMDFLTGMLDDATYCGDADAEKADESPKK